jgi:hypothetical protein
MCLAADWRRNAGQRPPLVITVDHGLRREARQQKPPEVAGRASAPRPCASSGFGVTLHGGAGCIAAATSRPEAQRLPASAPHGRGAQRARHCRVSADGSAQPSEPGRDAAWIRPSRGSGLAGLSGMKRTRALPGARPAAPCGLAGTAARTFRTPASWPRLSARPGRGSKDPSERRNTALPARAHPREAMPRTMADAGPVARAPRRHRSPPRAGPMAAIETIVSGSVGTRSPGVSIADTPSSMPNPPLWQAHDGHPAPDSRIAAIGVRQRLRPALRASVVSGRMAARTRAIIRPHTRRLPPCLPRTMARCWWHARNRPWKGQGTSCASGPAVGVSGTDALKFAIPDNRAGR